MPERNHQDLARFVLPSGFRGRSAPYVQLWWFVQSTLFRWSPQFAYRFRATLLRLFGAQVGRNVLIRPTATVTYPWKLSLGDDVWVGDYAVLYSLGRIDVGASACISQYVHLCAGDHDYGDRTFPIRAMPIKIGDEAWLAADVFVAPGVSIGEACVVGARSSVFQDLPGGMVCMGSPCKPVKER